MNKNIYFTSDWHIGHDNVIKYSKRPFKDCDHMHRVLINNYNATVGINDICYFLGDVGLAKGELVEKVIKQLNGTKILVMGNHDKKGRQFWFKCGFVAVQNVAAISVAKELVTMTHCPLRGVYREDTTGMRGAEPGENWHKENKHQLFSIPNFGQYHVHGHCHAPNSGKSEVKLGRQWDIGVDGNKYTPVSLSQIESWIAIHKKGQVND